MYTMSPIGYGMIMKKSIKNGGSKERIISMGFERIPRKRISNISIKPINMRNPINQGMTNNRRGKISNAPM